jgi:hypothetical protein
MIYFRFSGRPVMISRFHPVPQRVKAQRATERPGMEQDALEQNWNNGMADAICGKPARRAD